MKPEQDPDVQLMLAVQRDDETAFETLFRKYINHVAWFARSFVRSDARAEEIAQETFVQVFRTRRRYRPRARFASWLYRITTNLCISETRRAEHRAAASIRGGAGTDELREEVGSYADPHGRTGEEELLARERADALRRSLLALPPQQRAAVWLARVEGFSYDEVAGSLGCTVSAVKSLIHRATVTLRDELRAIE